MKKIIAFILTLCIVQQAYNVFAATSTDNAVQQDCQAVTILKGINVIDDSFDADSYMTRGQFLKLAVHAMCKTADGAGDIPYTDVPSDSPYYGAVCMGYSLGLISPAEEFHPDANITFEQASKILVHILNYQGSATISGGYSTGYVQIANSLKLFDNVTYKSDEYVTGAVGATIIRNAMESHYMEADGTGKLDKSDNLYMNDYLDIYKGRGIVTSDGKIDFEGKNINGSSIKIDDEMMDSKFDIANLLGQEIIYYYHKDSDSDEKCVLYAEPTSQNSVFLINAKDISSETTTNRFVYEENRIKKAKTIASDATVIYNGKEIFAYKKNHLMPTVGTVKLIDNNGDSKIDIVISYDYKVAVVSIYNASSDKVIFKFSVPPVKLGDYEITSIIKGGKEIKASELKEWNVLNYYTTDDGIYAVVSEDIVSGNIDSVSTAKDDSFIIVDGVQYTVSPNYIVDSGELKAGERGVFGTDIMGNIIFADYSTTAQRNYSLMQYASFDESGSDRIYVRLFDTKGRTTSAVCSEKIRINDQTYEGEKAFKEIQDHCLYQLVVTDSNTDGEIIEIDYAKDYSDDLEYCGFDLDNFSLDKKINSVRFYQGCGGGCYIDSGLVIFSIPTDRTKYDLYKVEGMDKIGRDDITLENVNFYDLDKFNVPKVMVLTDVNESETVNVSLYDEWFVVTDVYVAINADEEPRTKVCGYHRNEYKEYWIAANGAKNVTNFMVPNDLRMGNPVPNNDRTMWGFIGHTYEDIRNGDIMQLGFNTKNEISCYRMLWSSELCGTDIHTDFDGNWGGNDLSFVKPGEYYEINENDGMTAVNPNFMTMCYTGFGEVVDVNGNFFRYKTACPLKTGAEVNRYEVERVQRALGSIYVIDLNGKKASVKKGSEADITVGDKVFVHVRDNRSFYMAVIHDNK